MEKAAAVVVTGRLVVDSSPEFSVASTVVVVAVIGIEEELL